jgi:3-deoxy-D-manno-octulosonic-acid transferase
MDPARADALRNQIGLASGRPVWIAGSTHPGEEEMVLDAFRAIRAKIPGLALLLAPRHIERSHDVAALLERSGFAFRRRTASAGPANPDVVLLDTMGELALAYAVGDVVFVGGSLVPIGGHDILQPLLQGKPTLFGPHMHNQREVAALAVESNACVQVQDASQLAETVARCLTDPAHARRLTDAGADLLARHRGAARAAADLLLELLARNPSENSVDRPALPPDFAAAPRMPDDEIQSAIARR